jgi:hypothetical protein
MIEGFQLSHSLQHAVETTSPRGVSSPPPFTRWRPFQPRATCAFSHVAHALDLYLLPVACARRRCVNLCFAFRATLRLLRHFFAGESTFAQSPLSLSPRH